MEPTLANIGLFLWRMDQSMVFGHYVYTHVPMTNDWNIVLPRTHNPIGDKGSQWSTYAIDTLKRWLLSSTHDSTLHDSFG